MFIFIFFSPQLQKNQKKTWPLLKKSISIQKKKKRTKNLFITTLNVNVLS